ncbi:hypothetical protein QYE76_046039 [Lolium multiflorum]|uniref:Uncharacterized protein n=1 Tax=Lolium multiflorum TaxID=4521 RepID=A0AAD8TMM2_LOLMU|nr:hypothetical protein QYE76_046039 [Lolium multiflorum]
MYSGCPWLALFAPSPVHVAVRHERRQPLSSSSVFSMLQYWLGSAFEHLVVFEVGPNIFRLVVASPELASFLVSLDGLLHGQLVALFSMPRSLDALFASGPFLGPMLSPVTSALSLSVPSADGHVNPLPKPRPDLASMPTPSQRETAMCPNPSTTTPHVSRKSRRPPLCLSLLSPGIVPAPPGPMPWPVAPLSTPTRDPPPPPSTPRPAPLPSSGSPPASFPLWAELPRSGHFSPLGALEACAAMDGTPPLTYSQAVASPCKPSPPCPRGTPPPLRNLSRRCHRCLSVDHLVAQCRDPV